MTLATLSPTAIAPGSLVRLLDALIDLGVPMTTVHVVAAAVNQAVADARTKKRTPR